MKNCVTFPTVELSDQVSTAIHLAAPILFGLGLIGNALNLVALNGRTIRKLSAVYVYLCGMVVVDLFTLLAVVPREVRETSFLHPDVIYSQPMAYLYFFLYGFNDIFGHASIWLMTIAILVRVIEVAWKEKDLSWNTLGAARIFVLLVFIFCGLVNLPKFFEIATNEVKDHCFKPTKLWYYNWTEFSKNPAYQLIYPWVVASFCYALPYFIMTVCCLSLATGVGWRRLVKTRLAWRVPKLDEDVQLQTSYLLSVLSLLMIVANTPMAVHQFLVASLGKDFARSRLMIDFLNIAQCVVLIRCCLTFLLCSVYGSDFRKSLRRSFCCLCNTSDEFYEAPSCEGAFCCCCRAKSAPPQNSSSAKNSGKTSSTNSEEIVVQNGKLQKFDEGDVWI